MAFNELDIPDRIQLAYDKAAVKALQLSTARGTNFWNEMSSLGYRTPYDGEGAPLEIGSQTTPVDKTE